VPWKTVCTGLDKVLRAANEKVHRILSLLCTDVVLITG
jgi:hypothetical protein